MSEKGKGFPRSKKPTKRAKTAVSKKKRQDPKEPPKRLVQNGPKKKPLVDPANTNGEKRETLKKTVFARVAKI